MLRSAPVEAALPASDLARAKKFYEDVLGLEIHVEDPGGIEFLCGEGTKLMVYPSANAGTNRATAAGFTVQDVPATKKELEGRGVTFEEYDMPQVRDGIFTLPNGAQHAWFKDTEDNILSIKSD